MLRRSVDVNVRAVLSVGLVTLLILFAPGRALAHEGEEESSARTLVQQAIALLRGQPEQVEAIEDKIHDALEAEDAEGVDLGLVEQAHEAFEAGKPHEALDLLEEAVGAAPHRVVSSPNPGPGLPAQPTQPTEASPVLHETAFGGGLQAPGGTAGPALLAAAAALALVGAIVIRRVH